METKQITETKKLYETTSKLKKKNENINEAHEQNTKQKTIRTITQL